jgi:FlaA1/EpsC-like NDP-sugar epimerase
MAKRLFDLVGPAWPAAAVAAAAGAGAGHQAGFARARCSSARSVWAAAAAVPHPQVPHHGGDAPARPAADGGRRPAHHARGAWLRRTRLDELPQLIDVLLGHMSLVGPRPEVPRYVAHYPPALRERVLAVRPGITDPSSLAFIDESELLAAAADPEREYIEHILPAKLQAAADYAERASLWTDLGSSCARCGCCGHAGMTAGRTVWHRLDALLARLRPHRVPLSLADRRGGGGACWNVTYLFRLGFERWISARPAYDGWVLAGVVRAYLAAFALMRMPQSLWRFSGFGEVKRLTLACAAAGTVLAALVVMGLGLRAGAARGAGLHPVVTLMGVCVVRIAYRMLYEHARARISGSERRCRRAIVMGAGAAARMLLAGIHEQGWTVLGLLDDDPAKRRTRIGRCRCWGRWTPCATRRCAARPRMSSWPCPRPRRRAPPRAGPGRHTGLPVLTVPTVDELREGRSRIERLRDIEPEDLLGRAPVQLDEAGIGDTLRGKVVLITGAGGSIGSELCRQVARYAPARLVLLELSEFNLYTIEQELASVSEAGTGAPDRRREGPGTPAPPCAAWRPQVVFHAAAYKHVPLMEDHNAWAALRNNTLGTWQAALAAAEAGVERFVLISTDKAVNPTNVMGASKRAAEMVSALVPQHPGTRFMAVRFGNVLGSSGSVIPKFKEQIARGGPVTVTHPDIIRYFMTIPEAARLVLQAAAIGESGQVLVLDMGEPVKIVDLARDLIRLAGHTWTRSRSSSPACGRARSSTRNCWPTRRRHLVAAELHRLEGDEQDVQRHLQQRHVHAHLRQCQDRCQHGGLLGIDLVGQAHLMVVAHAAHGHVGLDHHPLREPPHHQLGRQRCGSNSSSRWLDIMVAAPM